MCDQSCLCGFLLLAGASSLWPLEWALPVYQLNSHKNIIPYWWWVVVKSKVCRATQGRSAFVVLFYVDLWYKTQALFERSIIANYLFFHRKVDRVMQLAIILVVAYLVGAVPSGVVLTRIAGAGDVRQSGSGWCGCVGFCWSVVALALCVSRVNLCGSADPVCGLSVGQFPPRDHGNCFDCQWHYLPPFF